jgi:hypothetical protein
MKNLDTLIKQYRSNKKQQSLLNKKILNLQNKINDIRENVNIANTEAEELKTMIDFCIETGMEPTEAKLAYSINEMKQKNLLTNIYNQVSVGSIGTFNNNAPCHWNSNRNNQRNEIRWTSQNF